MKSKVMKRKTCFETGVWGGKCGSQRGGGRMGPTHKKKKKKSITVPTGETGT